MKLAAKEEKGEEVTKKEKAKPYHRYVNLSRTWNYMHRLRAQWAELVPNYPFPVLKDEDMAREEYEALVQYFNEGGDGLDKVPIVEEPEIVYEGEGETEQERTGTSKGHTEAEAGQKQTEAEKGRLVLEQDCWMISWEASVRLQNEPYIKKADDTSDDSRKGGLQSARYVEGIRSAKHTKDSAENTRSLPWYGSDTELWSQSILTGE